MGKIKPYVKTDWVPGVTPVTRENMTNIEEQVESITNVLVEASSTDKSAGAIVVRNSEGKVEGDIAGNSGTTTKFDKKKLLKVTGVVNGQVQFDGSEEGDKIEIATTLDKGYQQLLDQKLECFLNTKHMQGCPTLGLGQYCYVINDIVVDGSRLYEVTDYAGEVKLDNGLWARLVPRKTITGDLSDLMFALTEKILEGLNQLEGVVLAIRTEKNSALTAINSDKVTALNDIALARGTALGTLEQYMHAAENGGNANSVQGYVPRNFKRTEDTIADLVSSASNKYRIGDIVDLNGYYTAGDGAGHKRKIEATDDGSGVQLANGLWANIARDLKQLNIVNTSKIKSKFRNNNSEIKITLFGDSIMYRPNLSSGDLIGNGGSEIVNTMISALNDYVYGGKINLSQNLSVPGDDLSRAWDRYKDYKIDGDVAFFCYGANDCKLNTYSHLDGTGYPVSKTEDTFGRFQIFLEKFIIKSITSNVVPVVIGTTSPRKKTQSQTDDKEPNRQNMAIMNEIARFVAEKYNCVYIDGAEAMLSLKDTAFKDNDEVHPDSAMSLIGKRLASSFLGQLLEFGKENSRVYNFDKKGVRKTNDNFLTKTSDFSIQLAPEFFETNSGEYLNSNNNIITYTFYTDKKMKVYPLIYIFRPLAEVECVLDFGISNEEYGGNEYNDFLEDIYELKFQHPSLNSSSKNSLFLEKNTTSKYLTINTPGWHSISLKISGEHSGVGGIAFEEVTSEAIMDVSKSPKTVDFITKQGIFYSEYDNSDISKRLPESINYTNGYYIENKKINNTTFQELKTEQGVFNRSISNGTKSSWKISEARGLLWEEIEDMNSINFADGVYSTDVNHDLHKSILNIPIIHPTSKGVAIVENRVFTNRTFVFQKITGIGFETSRFFTDSMWTEWETSLKTANMYKDLDTPYYTRKMEEEGIYADYVAYRDEQHEYEQSQREVEEKRQKAYQLALTENAELTYEEWLSGQPQLMPFVEPQPSQALLKFKEKHLG